MVFCGTGPVISTQRGGAMVYPQADAPSIFDPSLIGGEAAAALMREVPNFIGAT
jgi:hypothetical protein